MYSINLKLGQEMSRILFNSKKIWSARNSSGICLNLLAHEQLDSAQIKWKKKKLDMFYKIYFI